MTGPESALMPSFPPWHTPLWQRVITAHRCLRLGHALLLCGPNGVGKRIFARRLVGMLLCQSRDDRPCGSCPSCRQLTAGGHPGFTQLIRQEGRRDISIDAVRAMCSALTMTSHDGGEKVALLDPVDALNQNGVNALLKTLEEPSGGTLILVSELPLSLPATLRSRCQMLRFPMPAADDVSRWLAEEFPQSSNADRAKALTLARGAPLRAMDFLKSPGLMAEAIGWEAMIRSLLDGRGDPVELASRIDSDQAKNFLDWLAGWIRDNLCGEGRTTVASRALARLGQDVFDAARLIKSNVKTQLVIEALLIEMTRSSSEKPVVWRSMLPMGGGL